ncbi:hypothetical protein DVA81_19665, partial [Acinetobacter baumannii]
KRERYLKQSAKDFWVASQKFDLEGGGVLWKFCLTNLDSYFYISDHSPGIMNVLSTFQDSIHKQYLCNYNNHKIFHNIISE